MFASYICTIVMIDWLIDIGLHIQEKHYVLNTWQMSEKNLLNSPLLNWDGILEK
jgi:hypothetical protein